MDKMTDNPYPIYIGRQTFTKILTSLFGFFIFLVVGSIFALSFKGVMGFIFIIPLLGFFIFITLVVLVYNLLYLNAISYSVTNVQFGLKGGIIARFEKILPYTKIQHAIVTRSFTQRIMGLSTVVIQTASPADGGMAFNYGYSRGRNNPFAGSPRIPGLDKDDAKKLRDYIIARVLRSKSGQGI